ncbi:magnesium transporter, partial [Treponema pallidum]
MNENFEKIQTLLEHKRYVPLIANLNEMNEVDVAHVLDMQSPAQALLLFRMLPKNLAANVFAQLSSSKQSAFLATITDRELAPILAELAMDDIVDLVEEMPANAVKRILAQTGETERQVINQLLKYPEDSAGSLMTTEYVDLEKQMTVHDALCCIRETGLKKETVYTCYVIDQNRFLHGVIS